MWIISGEALHRSARPSSIPLKIGIVRVFSKKQTSIFYLAQRIFIAESCALVLFKGILLSKNKKNHQQQFLNFAQ
jgi:hypothetical protein